MRVTIKDIARETGLSVSAVSLVLNDRPCRVSAENKDRIRETAKKLHYSANQVARSLVTKKTDMLALVLPDIENIFFSSLAKQIEACCRKEGYALIISNSDDSCENELYLLERMAARGVDGVFLIASNESYRDNTRLVKQLQSLTVPFVMVDRVYPDLECDKVLFDNERGAYLAVSHLLENGHRKIACVTSPVSFNNGRARLTGYLNALRDYGCRASPEYFEEGDYHFESGYRAAEKLLKTDATAAFVCNDMMALGFLKYLFRQNVRVPQDFSVVSYDNSLSPFVLGVDLTSVSQDVRQLGIAAGNMMLDRLKSVTHPPQTVVLTPELVVRGSVKML